MLKNEQSHRFQLFPLKNDHYHVPFISERDNVIVSLSSLTIEVLYAVEIYVHKKLGR